MRLRMSVLLLAGLCLLASAGYAQQTMGTISGTVTDSSGAVLPGAQVVILNEETGISRTVTANEAGRYVAPALGLGQYRVTATTAGFQTSVRSGIGLTVGREAVVNFQLAVGAITQTVEVTGEAPLVEMTKGGLGTLVDSNTIEELPLNGRDLAQLITLQTGAVEYTAGDEDLGSGKLMVISGARPTTNVFMIDGVAIESYTQKTPTGTSGQFLGAEAVREFRVETNAYSAEYGRGAGGIFNVATKAGTNTFHGSLFGYHRNDNLDAYRWESKRSPGIEPDKPEFKRNQFGGSLGGPIIRDRTHFFGTYEALRERLGDVNTLSTFSDTLRAGILPSGTQVPIATAVQPYLNSALWPKPNVVCSQSCNSTTADAFDRNDGTAEYVFNTSVPTDEDMFQVRIDHKLSDSDSIFGRYTWLDSSQLNTLGFPYELAALSVRNHSLAVEENRIFSPTLLNTFRFGMSRNVPVDDAIQEPPFPESLYFVPRTGQVGGISISSGPSGVGNGIPGEKRAVNSFQYIDDMTLTKGRNTMKFGAHFNRVQFNGFNPGRDAAQYAFRSVENFFRGNANGRFRGSILDNYNDAHRSFRNWIIGLYFQDDFQMTPRLTLNLGMRYEFITTPSENHGRVANFKGDEAFILAVNDISGLTVGNPWIENPSLKNYAPRLGFAWDTMGNGKLALRGGFGLFFQQFDQSWYRTSGFRTPPILAEVDVAQTSGVNDTARVPFPNIYQLCGQENPFSPNIKPECAGAKAGPDVVANKFRNPYVMQYNLNTQWELLPNMVMTLGYAGSRGVRLSAVADINSWAATEVNGRLVYPTNLTARPNSFFDLIRLRHVGYDSWYNSMQMNVTRRFNQGLQFTGAYTWSKNTDEISGIQTASDTNSGPNTVPNFRHPQLYKGRSSFDANHVASFTTVYELPFGPGKMWGSSLSGIGKHIAAGWQVSGIVALNSGFPASISTGSRFATIGHGEEFPDLVPGFSNNPISGESAGCLINANGTISPPLAAGAAVPANARNILPGTELGTPDVWYDPCAFVVPPARTLGNLGRNTISMPGRATVDLNLSKNFDVTEAVKVQFKFDVFNLLNRPNFGTPSRNTFDANGRPSQTAAQITSTVLTPRQVQLALRLTF